jgi:hypothetical protein
MLKLIEEIKKDEIKLFISDSDLHILEKIQNEIYLEKKDYIGAFENVGTFIQSDNKVNFNLTNCILGKVLKNIIKDL